MSDDWLFIENTGHPYDPEFPYLVVNVSNEPVARFTIKLGALMFVRDVLECYGRIIDTTPKDSGTQLSPNGERNTQP